MRTTALIELKTNVRLLMNVGCLPFPSMKGILDTNYYVFQFGVDVGESLHDWVEGAYDLMLSLCEFSDLTIFPNGILLQIKMVRQRTPHQPIHYLFSYFWKPLGSQIIIV